MNILEPIFERVNIHHSYACRKGKGTHAAILYAFKKCKANAWFLKLDIRKYFDSIEHNVLKNQLHRLIKDVKVLFLLEGIIDSYQMQENTGVPIGNLTSQFFANMYLASLDHYIIENLKPSAYCRYMDDFVLWANTLSELKEMFQKINGYIKTKLQLNLKQEIYGKTANGLPFLGFKIKSTGIFLLKKSIKRVKTRISEIDTLLNRSIISEEKAGKRITSVFAAIALAKTMTFRLKLFKGKS
jgi:retron-type reverse transcriptase